jgi:hypothetical protein
MEMEYVTSEQDGVDVEESGDRWTWLQLICCALSQLLCPVFQNHMRDCYEDPEESSEENSVMKGLDWRQKTGGILVDISDADYRVYTWLYTNERMQG